MDQHYDEFFENAMKASDKGKFLKLPRFQKNLKYNFDGLYNYNTRIARLDLPTPQNNNQDRQVVGDLHHPLQLHPPTPGGSLWLPRNIARLMYIWKY